MCLDCITCKDAALGNEEGWIEVKRRMGKTRPTISGRERDDDNGAW